MKAFGGNAPFQLIDAISFLKDFGLLDLEEAHKAVKKPRIHITNPSVSSVFFSCHF